MENKNNRTLMTDWYELTMAQTYFDAGLKDKVAYFDVFFRNNPFEGGYTISGGLDEIINYIKNFKITWKDVNELRKANASGNSVVTFTIAINEFKGKNPDGTLVKTSSFIPCVVFGERGESVTKTARKGMLVGVEGRLVQRSYLKADQSKASVIEVVCDVVRVLEKRESVENEEMEIPPFDDEAPVDDNKNLDGIDISDDDLPF